MILNLLSRSPLLTRVFWFYIRWRLSKASEINFAAQSIVLGRLAEELAKVEEGDEL